MDKLRFYTENIGPIVENEKITLQKAFQLVEEIDEIQEITLLIPTQSTTGYFERIFGTDRIKGLFTGKYKVFNGGPRLKIETTKTIRDNNIKRILVSFGLSSDKLFNYDGFSSVAAIIGHQEYKDGLKDWAEAWGAEEILSGTIKLKSSNLDKVVKCAFDDLSAVINISTGITHSMDEMMCKTFLRALHKYGYDLNEKDISSYLITEKGWDSKHAKDVIKLISKLNSGSYFQGGQKTGLQNFTKNWKSR